MIDRLIAYCAIALASSLIGLLIGIVGTSYTLAERYNLPLVEEEKQD